MKAQTTYNPNLLAKIKQELVQREALVYVAVKASSYKYKALHHLERAAGREAIETFADILKVVGLLEESGDDLMCRRSKENECLIEAPRSKLRGMRRTCVFNTKGDDSMRIGFIG